MKPSGEIRECVAQVPAHPGNGISGETYGTATMETDAGDEVDACILDFDGADKIELPLHPLAEFEAQGSGRRSFPAACSGWRIEAQRVGVRYEVFAVFVG